MRCGSRELRLLRRSKEELSFTFLLTEQFFHYKNYVWDRFDIKAQWQMFLLLYGRHVGAPRKGTNMASPHNALFGWITFIKNARMKNRTDINLGKAVYMSIIYHTPDSCLNLLNGYGFHFWCHNTVQPILSGHTLLSDQLVLLRE